MEITLPNNSFHFVSNKESNKSRLIDMSNQLRQTLLAHRLQLSQKFGRKLPQCQFEDSSIQLVFPNCEGQPADPDNLRNRVFCKIVEKADLPKFRIHDIRHTFASSLLSQGEPLNYVKEQLGHASIQTTVDVYGHIVPGSNRNAVNKLDDDVQLNLKLVTNAS